ncbi:MAG: dockerin type I repeat-containing protein, partial [Acutalibacteraceae bacterium]
MKKQRKALSLVLVVAMILSMFAMAIPSVSAAEDVLNGKVIGILGDVDQSGKIDIKDATLIQKAVADVVTLTDEQQILANVDGGKLTVNDATWVQKYVAGYDCSALGIGKDVVVPDEQPTTAPVDPTEPTAETTAPVDPTEPTAETTAPVDPSDPTEP